MAITARSPRCPSPRVRPRAGARPRRRWRHRRGRRTHPGSRGGAATRPGTVAGAGRTGRRKRRQRPRRLAGRLHPRRPRHAGAGRQLRRAGVPHPGPDRCTRDRLHPDPRQTTAPDPGATRPERFPAPPPGHGPVRHLAHHDVPRRRRSAGVRGLRAGRAQRGADPRPRHRGRRYLPPRAPAAPVHDRHHPGRLHGDAHGRPRPRHRESPVLVGLAGRSSRDGPAALPRRVRPPRRTPHRRPRVPARAPHR